MMSMRDRYYNDAAFHGLVDTMVSTIAQNMFTPSEMRQAAVLASIIYEERNIHHFSLCHDPEVEAALNVLSDKIGQVEKEVSQ